MKKGETQKNKRRQIILLLGMTVLAFGALFAVSRVVRAISFEEPSSTFGLTTTELRVTIVRFINWALGLLGLVAVGVMLWGGFTWMTAHGDEKRLKKAKKILLNGVIGLVIILLAWSLINFVFNLGNASNTNGTPPPPCNDGDTAVCLLCVSGSWIYNPSNPGCNYPAERFEIMNFVTSCEVPPPAGKYSEKVYRCSAVTAVFNHKVKEDTVTPRITDDTLKVEECGAGSDQDNCLSPSQPAPLFGAAPNEIVYSGSTPTGTKAEFVLNNNALNFLHAHELFKANTYYRVTIPRNVNDLAGNNIKFTQDPVGVPIPCVPSSGPIPGCMVSLTEVTWIFRVGTESDITPPTITSTYPVSSGAGYPDRNVDQPLSIIVKYSEPIAAWSVTHTNVTISPITGTVASDGSGGTVGTAIAASNYDFSYDPGGGFSVGPLGGFQLDPFAWYEVTVKDIADLCSNVQSPASTTWRFETNGNGASVAGVFPPDGFLGACPATPIFIDFNTSMYDTFTHSCQAVPTVGGYVESGTVTPNIIRVFNVEDPVPPGQLPNTYCKRYSWKPENGPGQLSIGTNYSVAVGTRYQIDKTGTKLSKSWGFKTTDPASCVVPPYISTLSPDHGLPGQCMSVLGIGFGNSRVTPFGTSALSFAGTPIVASDIKTWSDGFVVNFAPNGSGTQKVKVTVAMPPPYGMMDSNEKDFNFTGSTAYTGPCLYSLNPNTGFRNTSFDLIGDRFDPASSTKKIHFYDIFLGDLGGNKTWSSDTVANMTVPNTASEDQNALVSLENDQDESNKLPFFVSKIPPVTFQVIEKMPICTSGGACPNADVRARFSQALDPGTVTPGSTSGAGNFELYKCPTPTCGVVTNADRVNVKLGVAPYLYVPGDVDVHFPEDPELQAGSWYRGVVHGGPTGVKSDDGKELGGLNYDLGSTGTNNSYSWLFYSAPAASNCGIKTVECNPSSTSIPLGGSQWLTSKAKTAPNTCNPAGEELDPFLFPWTWSSADSVKVEVDTARILPSNNALGKQATVAPVPVTARAVMLQNQCMVSVTTTGCVIDADCHPSGTCTGSSCVAGNCTPTVESITPSTGMVGDWVTVDGCYFGSYVGGQSLVKFLQTAAPGDDRTALWPSTAICGAPGATWTGKQIIIEVPNKTTASTADDVTVIGPLQVVRGTDGVTALSLDFLPTGTIPKPGICAVNPPSGKPVITTVSIKGQNFGTTQAAGDAAVFYNGLSVPPSETPLWSENEIRAKVPEAAQNAPPGLPENGMELYVTRSAQESNHVNFDVLPIDCTTCSADNSCSGGTTKGCGHAGPFMCCMDRPKVDTFTPTGPQVCRNAAITFSFVNAVSSLPIAMDLSTITPTTVHLFNQTDSVPVALTQSQIQFPSSHSVEINPGLLGRKKSYQVMITGDPDKTDAVPQGVQSAMHIGLDGDYAWTFTTADEDNVCRIGSVRLDPGSYLLTFLGETVQANAKAYDVDGTTQILPINAIYDWTWQWGTADSLIATVSNLPVANPASLQTITAVGKGTTALNLVAQAKTGWTGSKTAQATIVVDACNTPWPAVPPLVDAQTNFSTWYCRDDGALPALNIKQKSATPSTAGEDEIMREYFFENPNTNTVTHKNDAIGIMVWENESQLSPVGWHQKKFNKRAGGGISKVDGYEAMRVGTTVYVAGTNLAGGTLYTNMYVLGYNEDAGQETVAIFNQILQNFHLNFNAAAFAYGTTTAPTALDQVRLDTQRITGLKEYARALVDYEKKKGAFPTLGAGSYINGISTSTWPSWTATLGAELGATVPDLYVNHVDPINAFGTSPACTTTVPPAPPDFEPATCWNELAKAFTCNAGSHVYAYRSSAGTSFDLFANFDYQGTGSWTTGSSVDLCNPPVAGATCSSTCFDYKFHGIPGMVVLGPASAIPGGTGGAVAGATAPTSPTDVTARAAGANAVTLNWTTVGDEVDVRYYRVQRWEEEGEKTFLGQVLHPSSSYTDNTARAGRHYSYNIVAVDYFGGVSAPSSTARAVTPSSGDVLPPSNPSNLTATPQGKNLMLRWHNPNDTDLAGLLLFRKGGVVQSFQEGEDGVDRLTDLKPNITSFSVRGGATDDLVTFGLFAYDRDRNLSPGIFLQHGVLPKQPVAVQVPLSTVRNFVAAAEGDGVTLTWINPDDERYTGVMIRRSSGIAPTSPTDGDLVAVVPSPRTTLHDGSATGSVSWQYAAFSTDAAGPHGNPVRADVSGAAPFGGDVLSFHAQGGDGFVLLAWSVRLNQDNASVTLRRSATAFPTSVKDGDSVGDIQGTSVTDRSVKNGTLYYYAAFSGAGRAAFAKAQPDRSSLSFSSFRIPATTIGTDRAVVRWTSSSPSTTIVRLGKTLDYEMGSFLIGAMTTDHQWDSQAFGLSLSPNTLYHIRAVSVDAIGGSTETADHALVTDSVDAAGRTWQGYEETLTVASWNGSQDATTCDRTCNQFYACTPEGRPRCDDVRNGGKNNPGASKTCGALAYADCLDGSAHLPQGGNGTISQSFLNQWNGSRLPRASEFTQVCSSSAAPVGMTSRLGAWVLDGVDRADQAILLGVGGSTSVCTTSSPDFLGALHSLMILSPSP